LNSAGLGFLRKAAGEKFCTFLLDEDGQFAEAEFYIATSFPGIKQITVIGDPQQLPATVIALACKNAGYGNSWLGQVYK
jgi:senataxin